MFADLEDEIADLDDERGTAPGGGRATADPEEHDDYYADDVSDEMGDFIVDGDGDDEGASRARRRKKKQHYAAAGLNSRAMQVGPLAVLMGETCDICPRAYLECSESGSRVQVVHVMQACQNLLVQV